MPPPPPPRAGAPAGKPRPVTAAYLERAAVHYLERYSSTAENLRRVLARKALRRLREAERALGPDAEAPPGIDLDAAIAAVVDKAVRSGLVDDASFAQAKVGSLMRRGASTRAIRTKLRDKGVPDGQAEAALAAEEPDELALARRHAQRKRLGPWRARPDPERRARDLAALCRAGFPYRIAAQALDEPADDEPDR